MEEIGKEHNFYQQAFRANKIVYSTRSADGYEANRESSNETLLLWKLRYPLVLDSDAPERFRARIKKISELRISIPSIFESGVDNQGVAYVISQWIDGDPLPSVKASNRQKEQLFLSAVRAVSMLHGADLLLGDLSADSFICTKDNRVLLQAFLGDYQADASKTALIPSASHLLYLSPEQRAGAPLDMAADVFALGVIGYELFSGHPIDSELRNEGILPAPSSISAGQPVWVDDIIGCCLADKSAGRFRNAQELYDEVDRSITSGRAPGGPGLWARRTMIVRPNTIRKIRKEDTEILKQDYESTAPSSVASAKKRQGLTTIIGVSIALALLVTGFYFIYENLFSAGEDQTVLLSTAAILDHASPELQRFVSEVVAPGVSDSQRISALERISSSEEPIAFALLAALVKDLDQASIAKRAEMLLIEHLRSKGLPRSADAIEKWFQASHQVQMSPSSSAAYPDLMRALNPQLRLDRRQLALHSAYSKSPVIAIQLGAALALDTEEKGTFTPIFRQLLSAEQKREDLHEKGASVLLAADRTLRTLYDKEFAESIQKFTPAELAWALRELSRQRDPLFPSVVKEILARNIVPPYQAVFLRLLHEAEKEYLSDDVRYALVRGARGEMTIDDVRSLGNWWDLRAEPALLAVCALSQDQEVAKAAFDTLSARSVRDEPAKSLLNWIRGGLWEHRTKLMKAVGILGHSTIATTEEINYAFDVLMPYSGSGSLLRYVIQSKEPRLIKVALNRLMEITPSDVLLPLLEYDDPSVRTAAVTALKGRNDLAVLQAIYRAHSRETDPNVRQAYVDAGHWVVEDR